ncbi:MAG: RNA polymerase sigma factor [Brevinematia bacterium]
MNFQDDEKIIEDLLRSKGQNKDRAFVLIFKKYQSFVYDFGRTLGIPKSDISDFVQEVFIKLYKHINKFNPNKKFFPWFYSIIRNQAYSFIKKVKRQKDSDLEIREYTTNPYEFSIETINLVREIISELPEKEREILFLRYYQELSVDEISEILNCSKRNIYYIIDKAIEKIKRELK